jgi:predicted hydrocarbon binding protein
MQSSMRMGANLAQERGSLERFHPALLHSVLVSLRRFEPDFYAHISRAFHLDADRVMGLFEQIDEIGPGPLIEMLVEVRQHHAYNEIMRLAGRNAVVEYAQAAGIRLGTRRGGEAAFRQLLKQVMPPLLGRSFINTMSRKDLVYVEITDSIFARGVLHPNPVCSFYAGALLELGQACTSDACMSAEVRCHAQAPELASCLFELGF